MATPALPVVNGSTSAAPGGAVPGSQPGNSGAEQSIPYARFKEVNDQLKAFKDLGFSPEEINEALVALAAFVQQAQVADQAPPANASNGNQQPANGQWTQKQWEEWIFQQFPWMRQMKESHDAQAQSTQSRNDWRVSQAQERLKRLAIKAGYKEEQLKQLEDIVAALIRGDANMKAAWDNGDLDVVEQAFKAHQTGFVEPAARNYATSVSGRKAANKAELAPKVTGGGSPAPQQPEKPKTVADAHQAAMDKLSEQGSDLPEGEEQIVQE